MANPSIILSSADIGSDATEDDFVDWCAYVMANIDDAAGFEVDVEAGTFGEPGNDVITGDAEQRETIREAIQALWERGCADKFAVAQRLPEEEYFVPRELTGG